MRDAQDQTIGTERFQVNQALFCRYTTLDIQINKQLITAMEPIFMSLIKDQLTGFVQVTDLYMMIHLFRAYGAIDKINLE